MTHSSEVPGITCGHTPTSMASITGRVSGARRSDPQSSEWPVLSVKYCITNWPGNLRSARSAASYPGWAGFPFARRVTGGQTLSQAPIPPGAVPLTTRVAGARRNCRAVARCSLAGDISRYAIAGGQPDLVSDCAPGLGAGHSRCGDAAMLPDICGQCGSGTPFRWSIDIHVTLSSTGPVFAGAARFSYALRGRFLSFFPHC
jgi:hypothetical protein